MLPNLIPVSGACSRCEAGSTTKVNWTVVPGQYVPYHEEPFEWCTLKERRVTPTYTRLGYDGRKRCRIPKGVCYGTVRCVFDNDPIEQAIHMAVPDNMVDSNPVNIRMVMGFEMFGRGIPYHNYENWSSGFEVSGKGYSCSAEYLDTAVFNWAKAVIAATGDQRRIDSFARFMEAPVGMKLP